MREKISVFVSHVASVLEFLITMMMSIGVIILCLQLVGSLIHIPGAGPFPEYEELLKIIFNLIIGVELIRMMYYHTADTVFEVLVFAIARQIIIDHSSAVNSLLGVCSIAVLFATNKYLSSRSRDFIRVNNEIISSEPVVKEEERKEESDVNEKVPEETDNEAEAETEAKETEAASKGEE